MCGKRAAPDVMAAICTIYRYSQAIVYIARHLGMLQTTVSNIIHRSTLRTTQDTPWRLGHLENCIKIWVSDTCSNSIRMHVLHWCGHPECYGGEYSSQNLYRVSKEKLLANYIEGVPSRT